MLALGSPVDSVDGQVYINPVRGIELTDDLIVPWPAKLQQVSKPHCAQITNKCLNLRLLPKTKMESVNALYLNDWRHALLLRPEVHQVSIEVNVKRVPKPILKP